MSSKANSTTHPSTAYFPFEATRDPETGMSPIFRAATHCFDYDDISASVVSFHVPTMTFVRSVTLLIAEGFTGTSSVTVGDGDAANGWIAAGTITPTTAGEMYFDYDSTYGVKGKLYEDGDTIDVTFGGATSWSAGSGKLIIEYLSYHEALTDT